MTSGRRIMRVKCSECRKEFPLNEDHTCGGNNEITEAVVNEAWKLRKIGAMTMREISTRLGVDKYKLIDAMEKSTDD